MFKTQDEEKKISILCDIWDGNKNKIQKFIATKIKIIFNAGWRFLLVSCHDENWCESNE